MSLPKTVMPTADLVLPISKKTVRVRAINTREEKTLLIHKEAGDTADIEAAVRDMIDECTFKELEIEKMYIPDLIAIFLKIIEMSKGSTVTHTYMCKKKLQNGNICNTEVTVNVDLNEVRYSEVKFTSDLVELTPTLKVQMQRVTPEIINNALLKAKNKIDYAFWVTAHCIVAIIDGEDMYNEFTPDEAYDWILELSSKMSEKLIEFTQDIPHAILRHTITCPSCGNTQEIVLTGLADFFPNGFLAII